MKILVVSCSPWRGDNSIGNSYTNIFQGMDVEIAHICCGSGAPDTDFVKRHFHISEKAIIKNLLHRDAPCGAACSGKSEDQALAAIGASSGLYDFMRKTRLTLFFWMRELIWSFGNWKTGELERFVRSFEPDLIFAPMLNSAYLNRMLSHMKKLTQAPLVLYAWDDVYSLRQMAVSPLYWINRLVQRHYIKRSVRQSEKLFVISREQKEEYEKAFQKPCELLYKGYQFTSRPSYEAHEGPLRMVYTGMLGEGRWKTLIEIGRALEQIGGGQKAKLDIYSSTPLTGAMKKELEANDSMRFCGAVSSQEVSVIQEEADILLFCESFRKKDCLVVRLSFSTKLVDYFKKAKCIFAAGRQEGASMRYLREHDCAVVATQKEEIKAALQRLIEHPELRESYAQKAWDCGVHNHDIETIQAALSQSLREAAGQKSSRKRIKS